MNLFLDTNIWLRYFIGDSAEHLTLVKELLKKNEEGRVKLSTSSFILSEFIYVETALYVIPKRDIVEDLEVIRSVRNIWILEQTNFQASLNLFKRQQSKSYKWSDCMIAAQLPEEYMLCSFDARLERLVGKGKFIHPKALVF